MDNNIKDLITKTLTVRAGLNSVTARYVFLEEGPRIEVPEDWALLPPGDAAITKTLKKLGPSWTMKRKKGRKVFSDGVWAPKLNIDIAKRDVERKRSRPEYATKRASDLKRKEQKHQEYVKEFHKAVFNFLKFDDHYTEVAEELARQVTEHATPVGSGTVARTQRISTEEKAAAAVNAWMRHKTTEYDNMKIARVKGKRREVRRDLAKMSKQLLNSYRRGDVIDTDDCPLWNALH